MSNPRPIHSKPYREINEIPDTKEPSYSYEESLFRAGNGGVDGCDDTDDLGDIFHQRLEVASAQTSRRDSGGGGGGGNSSRNQDHNNNTAAFDNSNNHPKPKIMIHAGSLRKSNAPSLLSAVLSDHSSSSAASKQSGPTSTTSTTTASIQQTERNEPTTATSIGTAEHGSLLRKLDSSENSINSRNSIINRKKKEKDRAAERRRKLDAQSSDIDIGHIVDETTAQQLQQELLMDPESTNGVKRPSIDDDNHDDEDDDDGLAQDNNNNVVDISFLTKNANNNNSVLLPPLHIKDMPQAPAHKSLDRSSSDQSTGSLLYCRTPTSNIKIGGTIGVVSAAAMASSSSSTMNHSAMNNHKASLIKSTSTATSSSASSSLIFPTGVDGSASSRGGVGGDMSALRMIDSSGSELSQLKRRKINLCLDQCESIRFPFKKKLILQNMKLTAADIPLNDLCGTSLGNTLHKLSLSGNNLGSVPHKLVQSLPILRSLDLSRCELHQLPDRWNLPKLTRLNLSDNRFNDFPEESMLEGLPELQELNMYGNKVAEITIPTNPKLLSKLEVLDMGYNDLVFIPEELDQLKSLKTLRLTNNFLSKVPMRVCDMDALKIIDVTSNPITEPPIETCERGICSMKRYWHCIRHEEQSKKKALAEVQRKVHHHQKHQSASSNKKTSYGGFLLNTIKNPLPRKFGTGGSTCSTGTVNTTASLRSSSVEDEKLVSVPPPANESPRAPSAVDVQAGEMTKISASPTLDKARKISSSSSDHDQSLREGVETDKSSLLHDQVTVNDTLKVIFVGMAMVGKTSMIKRLIEGRYADVPTRDERTVGVDIYDWEPKNDKRFEHIDSRILFQDEKLAQACCDVDVKFSVWDFAGQHVYHATHELFFSCRALYVLVWDMGATNSATIRQKTTAMDNDGETGAFKLTYDSSDEEHEDNNSNDDKDLATEEECKRADRALQHDIDEKVQFWVDCIQSVCPGSAILPVASFDDAFHGSKWGGEAEAKRRCSMLKERLLQHEERSINGIQKRLQEFVDQNRADDIAAKRLRNLTCPYTRPKLIFGDDDDPVVRVSCSDYTGFDRLTEKIIGIATGSIKASRKYPIFHGHIGARIPRMRLEVREAVRRMRGKFKVVEWGYFINVLRDQGLTNVEDISEALHFLTNTGELSYFGGVMAGSQDSSLQNFKSSIDDHRKSHKSGDCCDIDGEVGEHVDEGDDDDVDDDDENAMLSMDDTSITAQSTADGSLSTVEDFMSTGLSQFIFLNPRWLVAAVACILRHDLDREIKETRRVAASGGNPSFTRTASFYDAHLNCPVITAEDACLLWQYKRITKKAADRAQEYSNNMTVTPFEFLQMLLIRFGVFVPIDLSIDKALFGGKEYHQLVEESMNRDVLTESHSSSAPFILNPEENVKKAEFFFLPSLLGPNEPSEAWSYKTTDSWKTTLCHSILFPDGVPPGLTERLTAAVLSSIYAVSRRGDEGLGFNATRQELATVEGQLRVKEVFCWRTAFYVKLGTSIPQPDGSPKESCVEIFTHLAGKDSRLCVGSDYMAVGSRQIITCGRGQVGDGGRKIWKGGYLLVVKCIHRVMEAYTGLEYEKHGYCPECLAKKAVSEASSWDFPKIRAAVLNADETLRCHYGHRVDTRLIAGPYGNFQKPRKSVVGAGEVASVSVQDVLGAVVVVGLWDGKTRKIVRAGSGFIVDKKRGLIVTAAHTLINIWGDKNYPYGEDYYGLSQGRVVIGVIPLDKVGAGGDGGAESGSKVDIASMPAVFRYFAQIVAKDQSLDRGECHLDACVLRITTRMENDVGVDGDGCGDEPEILLLNDHRALKNEPLPKLKMTEKCELEEPVRLIGYNQGGGGVVLPGERLNRYADLAKGYVCMFFVHEEDYGKVRREKFKPREEIVVMCPNIGGHSGGPCINQQGEVIGILSRADPAEHQRCYLVPTKQLKVLVNRAKKIL